VGKEVILDASGSKDPEGKALQFSWRFLDIPKTSNAALSSEKAPTTRFIADSVGSYFIEIEVSDGEKTAKKTVEILASEGTFAIRRNVGWSRLVEPDGLVVSKSVVALTCPTPFAVDRAPDGRLLGVPAFTEAPVLYEYSVSDGSCRKVAELPKVMTALAVRADGKIVTISDEGAFRKRSVHIFDEFGRELNSATLRVRTPGGFFDPEEEVHRVDGIDFGPDQKLYSVNFASIWILDPETGEADYRTGYSGAAYDVDIDKFGVMRAISFGKLVIFDLTSNSIRDEYRLEWDDFAFSPLVRL
jgi:hypothetical protein